MAGDQELHARLVGGDLAALAAVYDEHAPYVYGVAVKVTGSAAVAEEITQEVFTALWERPMAYEPRLGTLCGWLVSRSLHASATRAKVS